MGLKTYLILAKNVQKHPNLMKHIHLQIQEAGQVPKRVNSEKLMPSHLIINCSKTKGNEKILKASRKKLSVTYVTLV